MHDIWLIAVAALVTAATRFLPFLIFGENRKTPPIIAYLGQVLPYAIMGLALLVAGLVGSSGTSLTFWGIVVLVFLAGLLLLRRIWRKYLH